MKSVDVHQHLWPGGVLSVLERRAEAPRAAWNGKLWHVDLCGEPSFDIDPADHDPEERAHGLEVDQALVALSSPVGLEELPAKDALAATTAWHEAAKDLPSAFGWWSAIPAALPVEDGVALIRAAVLDGAAGVCLPATRLATPAAAESVLPLLQAVSDAGAAAFVHPGPTADGVSSGVPGWWAPATGYVAQQHAAWHAFHLTVRPQLPKLRVIFALLAGLAPLHAERTTQRSDAALEGALADQLAFYDTSSYGPRAVGAMATAVGIGQLVYGSDYPVSPAASDPVQEAFNPGVADLVQRDGPARALGYTWVPA